MLAVCSKVLTFTMCLVLISVRELTSSHDFFFICTKPPTTIRDAVEDRLCNLFFAKRQPAYNIVVVGTNIEKQN